MVKFGQDITWVVIIKITQLLALHLVAEFMLPLEVTPSSITPVYTSYLGSLSKFGQ